MSTGNYGYVVLKAGPGTPGCTGTTDDRGHMSWKPSVGTWAIYPDQLENLMSAAQEAANASIGDSNDAEISALQEALEYALEALNLTMPEPEEEVA